VVDCAVRSSPIIISVASAIVNADGDFRPVLSDLTDDERARADRFHFAPDRASYITAHALLRTAVAEYGGIARAHVRLGSDLTGRPQILDPEPLRDVRVSLSHTRHLTACAVCPVDIGVDVEELADVPWDVVERYFCRDEKQFLSSLAPDDARTTFYRCWTLKEACLKALGIGLSDSALRQTSFRPQGDGPQRATFAAAWNDDPRDWFFVSQLMFRHAIGVAVRAGKRAMSPSVVIEPPRVLVGSQRA